MPITAQSGTAILDIDPGSANIPASFGDFGRSVGPHATRTKLEREAYKVRRFLSARLCNDHLRDAGRLSKHESPDFLFQLRDGKIIGIEVTEASEPASHLLYITEEKSPADNQFSRALPPYEKPTIHLANLIFRRIVKKVRKTRKEQWTKCVRNEVVIYPNYYHSNFADDDRILSLLKIWLRGSRFSMIDSLGNRVLIHILFEKRVIFDVLGANESLPLTPELQ